MKMAALKHSHFKEEKFKQRCDDFFELLFLFSTLSRQYRQHHSDLCNRVFQLAYQLLKNESLFLEDHLLAIDS